MGKGIKKIFALAAVLAVLVVQAGCGKKGPPVAPKPKTASAAKTISAISVWTR